MSDTGQHSQFLRCLDTEHRHGYLLADPADPSALKSEPSATETEQPTTFSLSEEKIWKQGLCNCFGDI